jgi:PAS domain S-box-containing protein
MLLDAEHRILRCNDATAKLLGKETGEIVGHHCWELFHVTSEPIEGCPIVRMSKTLHKETMSLPIGGRWFEVSVDPMLDQARRLTGSVHIISDITERREMQNALRESEDRYGCLLESMSEQIAVFDGEWRCLLANEALAHSIKIPKEQLLGRKNHRGSPMYREIDVLRDRRTCNKIPTACNSH